MVRLVDDVDKDSDADRTISFALAGKQYDIDLCTANAEQFEAELSYWIGYARKRGTHPTVVPARRSAEITAAADTDTDDEWWRTPADANEAEQERYHNMRQEIRRWGVRNGYPSLGARGKLPCALYAKWRKSHAGKDKHRTPDPEGEPDAESGEPSELESAPGQAELDMVPAFSHGKRASSKPAEKKPTRAPGKVKAAMS